MLTSFPNFDAKGYRYTALGNILHWDRIDLTAATFPLQLTNKQSRSGNRTSGCWLSNSFISPLFVSLP